MSTDNSHSQRAQNLLQFLVESLPYLESSNWYSYQESKANNGIRYYPQREERGEETTNKTANKTAKGKEREKEKGKEKESKSSSSPIAVSFSNSNSLPEGRKINNSSSPKTKSKKITDYLSPSSFSSSSSSS